MTRLLKLATIILAVVSFASAQLVDTLNTPIGPVTQGANVPVSWTLIAGVDATGKTGSLSAQDMASKNTITIDPAVPLAPKTYTWNVVVPPGTYTLGLNDGSGLKQSGTVDVVGAAGAGGKAPAPAPGAPAPAPGAPAPAPGTPAPKTSPAPAPGAPAPAPSNGTPNTPNTPNTPTPSDANAPAGAPTPATTPSSASSIFSGYNVVFSLLGVAIAMVQF